MTGRTLAYYFDRVRLGLRTETCGFCREMPLPSRKALMCAVCEAQLLRDPQSPVLEMPRGALYAVSDFPPMVKRLIYDLKFSGKTANAALLSELMIHYRQLQQAPQADIERWVVVPIPAHDARGFQPVPLFARPMASHFGHDFMDDGLLWARPILKQHGILSRRKRRENVDGAFQVNPALLNRLGPQTGILVVDDLLTTGATMREAVATLTAGTDAPVIQGLALANVPLVLRRRTADVRVV